MSTTVSKFHVKTAQWKICQNINNNYLSLTGGIFTFYSVLPKFTKCTQIIYTMIKQSGIQKRWRLLQLWKQFCESTFYIRNEYTNEGSEYSVFQRSSSCCFIDSHHIFHNYIFFLSKGKNDIYALHLSPVLLVTWKFEMTSLPKLILLYILLITTDFR